LQQVDIGGGVINYIDKGSGTPVVFVHGAMEDYRSWEPQIESFSKNYRVIAYSRRYNYPNQNANEIVNFSEETEANDLEALIRKLNLGPVHVVGHSFGGLTALAFAIKHPDLTKSLTLSEPPLYNWLPDIPGGQDKYESFYNYLWRPVKIAFDIRDTADVLRHTLTYFAGEDISAQLPPDMKSMIIANFPEWKALANSKTAFTIIKREDVSALKMPVLILTSGKTFPAMELTNAELVKILPKAQHFNLPDGTHDYWFTHPQIMGDTVFKFLENCK